jgi:hypothetical protein
MSIQNNNVESIHDLGISSKGCVPSNVSKYFIVGINHENSIIKIRLVIIEVNTPKIINVSFFCLFKIAKLFIKNDLISVKDGKECSLCNVSNVFILDASRKKICSKVYEQLYHKMYI